MGYNLSNLLYLITIVTFILALRFLSSPAHARRGNLIGAAGMLVAIAVTFAGAPLSFDFVLRVAEYLRSSDALRALIKLLASRDAELRQRMARLECEVAKLDERFAEQELAAGATHGRG